MYFKIVLLIFSQLVAINAIFNILPVTRRFILPIIPPKVAYTNCQTPGYEKWITFDNKTCYFVSLVSPRVTWHDANEICRTKNSQLLSIHDRNTNLLFANLRPQYYYSLLFWIGLNSLSKRGIYKWSDGTATQYTDYANTTINGAKLPPQDIYFQGRCVVMQGIGTTVNTNTNSGFWYRDDCNSLNGFICAKNPTNTAVIPTTPIPPGNCPSDWIQYANQKCIKILDQNQNGLMTWGQAKGKCNALQGEIISIHSAEEQNFVTSLIANKPMPFIGMTRNNTKYKWVWDDQTRINYDNWAPQNDVAYNSIQNCVVMITNETQAGKWFKTPCNTSHIAVCEKPKDPAIITPPAKAFLPCTIPGFEKFVQYRNSCYLFVDDPNSLQTFDNAESNCLKFNGAHLASIVNPFEYAFLKYYITQNGKSDQYWIGFYAAGFSQVNVSQVFKWTDNWPNYFTKWDDNEPLFAGETDKECVYQSKGNGTWRTADCVASRAYICKTTLNPIPQMNTDMTGICPKLNTTNIKMQWLDLDKRSKYCYWFSADINTNLGQGLLSWTDASFRCRKRNGTLASIHTNHDLSLMRDKLSNSQFNTWIGLFKSQNGDFMWDDGSAVDFTNWDEDQQIVNKQLPINDDSGDMCVETKSLDLKWRQKKCTGLNYMQNNLYVCHTNKIYKSALSSNTSSPLTPSSTSSSLTHSSSTSSRLYGGSKAGIAIGVIIGVAIIVGGSY